MPQHLWQSQEQEGNPATHFFPLALRERARVRVHWPCSGGKSPSPQPSPRGRGSNLLPLAIIGISGALEPRNAVGLQGVFARTGPLVRHLDPDETALEAGHDVAREQFIAMQRFFACG